MSGDECGVQDRGKRHHRKEEGTDARQKLDNEGHLKIHEASEEGIRMKNIPT